MSNSFDPNIPGVLPTDPSIEGDVTVQIKEKPSLGTANLVIDGDHPFDIEVAWNVKGTLVPLWLSALKNQKWVVTAYATPRGKGDGMYLDSTDVAVGAGPFKQLEAYAATLTIPAHKLPEENPGNKDQSGVYQITVTVFLNSDLGEVGYDMMGYADGPVIKVESPR